MATGWCTKTELIAPVACGSVQLISDEPAVPTGCGCGCGRSRSKNRTRPDLQTLTASQDTDIEEIENPKESPDEELGESSKMVS